MLPHSHDHALVVLSIFIAIFASYTSLDLCNSLTVSRGRARLAWWFGGSLAMGVGIWSMHFVAMLAMKVPGLAISYDVPLVILSVVVAILASGIALFIIARQQVSLADFIVGALIMGVAIAGMHYIGIASMRMAADLMWNWWLVAASVLIAIGASFVALQLAVRTRMDLSPKGFAKRGVGGVIMGLAISGMHFTGMAAMHMMPSQEAHFDSNYLLATQGLAVAVIGTTMLILLMALSGSVVDRAFTRQAFMMDQVKRILESITDGFYNIDHNWRVNYLNQVARDAFSRIRKTEFRDVEGQELLTVLPELKNTSFERAIRAVLTGRGPVQVEEYFPPLDAWFEARVYPSDGGASVYFRDITDRKHQEQLLREAIRARDEFLSIASHELKTPLSSLKLQTQMRQRDIDRDHHEAFEGEKLRRSVETDARQIARLTRLVEDMLDISQIAMGRLTIRREEFDLGEMVQDVVERLKGHFEASHCQVSSEIKPGLVGCWDRFRLEQVVTNLLTNACRYGNGKPVMVTVGRHGTHVRIAVRDYGIGIAAEDHERIFRRFERAVPATEISGLGLGLYIVKQIVEMHGGSVKVNSRPGEGSEFTVDLPLDSA